MKYKLSNILNTLFCITLINHFISGSEIEAIEIDKYFNIIDQKSFNNKIINVAYFDLRNEFIVVVEDENGEHQLECYKNNIKTWDLDLGHSSFFRSSKNGKVIYVFNRGSQEFYTNNGDLLFRAVGEGNHIISPDGQYIVEEAFGGGGGLYYYTNNGTKIKPEHNKDFSSYNFYMQFTDDNRIIFLYPGFKGDGGLNKTNAYYIHPDLPDQGSEVFLVDPEREKIVWTTKLSSELIFKLGIPSQYIIYMKDDKVFLFDREPFKKVLDIFCLDVNSGKVLWKSHYPDFPRPSRFVADDNWIYTVHFIYQKAEIYRIEIKTGKMEKINEYSRAHGEYLMHLQQINDVLFLYSKEGYSSKIVNIATPNGKIEEMDGFIKSNKGNINYINGNKIYKLKKKDF